MASKLLLSALVGLAAAQTTTVTVPFMGLDDFPISASVIAANPTATTYSLACGTPTSTDSDFDSLDCGLFPDHRLIYGPSTWAMEMGMPGPDSSFTGTVQCVGLSKPTMTCTESASGAEANFPGVTSTTLPRSELVDQKVVVTAGAEKLQGVATTTPASGSASPTASASSSGASASGAGASASAGMPGNSQNGSSITTPTTPAASTPSQGAADMLSIALGSGFIGAAAALVGGLVL
ncbi:unnamed protein product [Periconia digitata]|uniref:Uncharacterized protein n=1 Tax=Periconia digitata TaxID=1303443 RepID=A0A9W4UP30_9PLEO|nr:unnamed protein product [Periconia digitata]